MKIFLTIVMCLFAVPAWADVSVQGEGSAAVKPDLAHVSIAVVSEAKTPSEALAKNNASMTKLFGTLTELAIDTKDIQTTSLDLNPKYTRPVNGTEPVLLGYVVTNQVEICVRKLDAVGNVITSLVGDGANRLGGFRFGATNPQLAVNAARAKAMLDARSKADLLVTSVGATLGPVKTISEVSTSSQRHYARAALMDGAGGMDTPTSGGELNFRVEVHVVFEIAEPESRLIPHGPRTK